MHRSDLLRPSFRLKLLLALIGTIAPLLLVTLFIVRLEADRQVDSIVQSTANRAGDAFAQIERIRQQQLSQLGSRITNSNRWAAAVQQALEGDVPFFIETIRYDLELAGVPKALVAITDLSAEPVAASIDGAALPDPAIAVSTSAIDRLFEGSDTAVFGYHLIARQLFSVHPIVVNLGQRPIGIMLLGFRIDDETARSLSQAVGADVCFVANKECVATSGDAFKGTQFANITRPLRGAGDGTVIALRIPLDEAIRPFAKIQRSIALVGFAAVGLAVLIALILSRGLAQPVRALVAATARVARGEYDTHVEVKSKDEIGLLAASFNEMTHGLLLKEKYRGVLDKVVSRDVADEMLKGEIRLGGETREVTTLFADIRNFTPMSEGMAPHDVVSLLNEIMDHGESAVVAEGGVVDKYVGDEIMALFGAPLARGEDALRAVRAALRIQEEIARLNSRRAAERKPAISIGIGINTGTVVAGNMGSARRLNYTVLGAPVNLAARLCAEAAGGQILISAETLERVQDHVAVTDLGPRPIKGISQPVRVFQVDQVHPVPLVPAAGVRSTLGLLATLLFAGATVGYAQRAVAVGPLEIVPSARIDVMGFLPGDAAPWLIGETKAFVAPRISGIADIFAGRRVYGLIELRVDRGEAPTAGDLDFRIEQAFVRLSPFNRHDASLQLGRFVTPFGAYPQRHHSTSDPLIRPPLAYDYRTMVSSTLVPLRNDGFIDWKLDPAFFRPIGAPPVWNAPYQLGAMVLGTAGRLSYRLAVMNGAPSTEPDVWNEWPGKLADVSYVANVGVQLTPELRLGASYDTGPYLHPDSTGAMLPGDAASQYPQTLLGLDVTFARGMWELRGELIHDTWEVPRVRDYPIDISYYGEARLKVGTGLFFAARYGEILFNELRYDDGSRSKWDYDIRRIQLGAGYRFTEKLDVRGEFMLNDSDAPSEPRDNLLSVQASWLVN